MANHSDGLISDFSQSLGVRPDRTLLFIIVHHSNLLSQELVECAWGIKDEHQLKFRHIAWYLLCMQASSTSNVARNR